MLRISNFIRGINIMRQKHGYIRKGWSLLLIMIPTQHYQFSYKRGHIAGNDRTSAIGRMNDKTQAPDQALSTLVVMEVEEVSLIGVLGFRFVVGGALRPRCRPKITSKSTLTYSSGLLVSTQTKTSLTLSRLLPKM